MSLTTNAGNGAVHGRPEPSDRARNGFRDASRLELEHLLRSGIVRERTHLHDLLAYLGSKALDDAAQPLKEYVIGVEALNKPADYDPRLDPTVRVEVAKLRKKLEEHYRGAGAGRPVKMVIPKGGYLPVFCEDAPALPPARPKRLPFPVYAGTLAVLAAIVFFLVFRRPAPGAYLSPDVEAFWAAHFQGRTPTLLVYGTPLFIKTDGSYHRDPRVNTMEEAAAREKLQRVIQALSPRESRPVFTFTGVGEAEALFLLTRVLASRHAAVDAQNSASVDWEDMKGKHVVLLGGRKYNPLIPGLPSKPKFEAVNRKIVNLSPSAGERAEYRTASKTPHGEIVEEYAVVSVYPGLSPGTRLVALDSSSTEGTMAAAEFITRPDTVHELVLRGVPLRPEAGRIRPFQVVVGARFNQGVPVKVSYVAHAILP